MTTPCRERLLAAAAAALEGLDDGGGGAVKITSFEADVENAACAVLLVEDDGEDGEADSLDSDWRCLNVAVSLYVAAAAEAGADRRAAAEAAARESRRRAAMLRAAIETRLTAPQRLGGVHYPPAAADLAHADDVRLASSQPAPDRPGPFAQGPAAAFTLLFDIDYRVAAGDPYSFA